MGYPVWGSHLGSHGVMDYKYLFIFFLNTFHFEVEDKSISILEKFFFRGLRYKKPTHFKIWMKKSHINNSRIRPSEKVRQVHVASLRYGPPPVRYVPRKSFNGLGTLGYGTTYWLVACVRMGGVFRVMGYENLFIFFLNTFDFEVDDKSISLLEKFFPGGLRYKKPTHFKIWMKKSHIINSRIRPSNNIERPVSLRSDMARDPLSHLGIPRA